MPDSKKLAATSHPLRCPLVLRPLHWLRHCLSSLLLLSIVRLPFSPPLSSPSQQCNDLSPILQPVRSRLAPGSERRWRRNQCVSPNTPPSLPQGKAHSSCLSLITPCSPYAELVKRSGVSPFPVFCVLTAQHGSGSDLSANHCSQHGTLGKRFEIEVKSDFSRIHVAPDAPLLTWLGLSLLPSSTHRSVSSPSTLLGSSSSPVTARSICTTSNSSATSRNSNLMWCLVRFVSLSHSQHL